MTIRYAFGDLFQADVEALVNPVNTVGIAGKGLALAFRERFPGNHESYVEACRQGRVRIGSVYVTETDWESRHRWIINFPTKKHWRLPSRLEWIDAGLDDLISAIREMGVCSIAIPALGCGLGGLPWYTVKRLIEQKLDVLDDVDVVIYAPVGT